MTPDEYTNQELMLDVGDGHQLYVHDWGNQAATSVIFHLHGGPGSQTRDKVKNSFDPTRQRVIFHDQRGCGRSTPYGSLEANTTQHLIADIQHIAATLKIDRFILSGGSWGSCLALAYALEHPERVTAMVLNGIFTGSQAEIDWVDKGLFKTFFPEAWDAYLQTVPEAHQDNPTQYHYQRLMGDDLAVAKASGIAYQTLEGALLSLDDRPHPPTPPDTFDPSSMRIELAYLQQNCFLADRHILDNASALTRPIWLIQGRYDMVCPPETAYELHQLLPNSELIMTVSGHHGEHETWNLIRTVLQTLTA